MMSSRPFCEAVLADLHTRLPATCASPSTSLTHLHIELLPLHDTCVRVGDVSSPTTTTARCVTLASPHQEVASSSLTTLPASSSTLCAWRIDVPVEEEASGSSPIKTKVFIFLVLPTVGEHNSVCVEVLEALRCCGEQQANSSQHAVRLFLSAADAGGAVIHHEADFEIL